MNTLLTILKTKFIFLSLQTTEQHSIFFCLVLRSPRTLPFFLFTLIKKIMDGLQVQSDWWAMKSSSLIMWSFIFANLHFWFLLTDPSEKPMILCLILEDSLVCLWWLYLLLPSTTSYPMSWRSPKTYFITPKINL